MRKVVITRPGPPSVLKVEESPDPNAGPGEVRIRVKAAGINFADLMARMGLYPDAPKLPTTVGYEASGEIDQLGAGVTNFAIGDRVFAMPHFGGHSDTLVLPIDQVFRMPAKMTFEEAGGMPVVYLTAHHCMMYTGHVRPGSTVLIHSVAGGVGLAAIELAKMQGATIIGTASAGKHDFLKERGVHHPLPPDCDLEKEVRAIVGEKGVDLVLDPVGGKSWSVGYELLAPGGRMVCYGFSSMAGGETRNIFRVVSRFLGMKSWNPMKLMNDNKEIAGVNMERFFKRLDIVRPQFDSLVSLYEQGKIKPFIDRTFKFEEAAEAHQYLHDRKAKGKVVLVP